MKRAVIYARFSSEKQREESIEGQIRKCKEYAERNGLTVIGEYIDRAISGKTDERPGFQAMIADGKNNKFDVVLVYAFDRFSRNSEHYYTYRNTLLKNSVELLSVTQEVAKGPSGILIESILVSYGEYYSAELAEKIRRGQTENALKLKYNGGSLPLGYKTDAEQHYIIDPTESAVVIEIFTKYANGETITEIISSLNSCGIRTKRGNKFNKNSLHTILTNRRYLGEYEYRDTVVPNAFDAIIPQELFDRVQKRMTVNKVASAHKKADEPFILTTKIFCGHCGAPMVGESGTGRNGKHYYYKCTKAKREKTCKKKSVRKYWIEDIVIDYIINFIFDDDKISKVADMVMELQEKGNTVMPLLKRELKEVTKGINNLLDAIQSVGISDSIKQRLMQLEKRKEEIETGIQIEKLKEKRISREEVVFWLKRLRSTDVNNITQREMLVSIFVNSVFVYDDRLLITFNYKDEAITATFAQANEAAGFGSDIDCLSPPKISLFYLEWRVFLFIQSITNSPR